MKFIQPVFVRIIFSLTLTALVAFGANAQVQPADGAITQAQAHIKSKGIDKGNDAWRVRLPKFTPLKFTGGVNYFWNVETNKGTMKIQLMHETAPNHVSSTIYLTELGFYDDLTFHRVIPGFMAQGGCPLGRGHGGPGYNYDGEFKGKTKHNKRGVLSMANTGRPTSDGSQFFILFGQAPHLDGKHTIFGQVVEGLDVLDKLEAAGSRRGTTSEPLKMVKSTISTEAAPVEK